MRKHGINVNFNIQKKHVWFLSGFIVLLAVVGFVVGVGVDPAIMGHGDIWIDDTTGNVGVGTATPSEKLAVDGNLKVGGDLIVDGSISGEDIGMNCKTFEFDASDRASGYRYFKFTMPYACEQPDEGDFGCDWQLHNVRNDGYPYSRSGKFYIQNDGSYLYFQSESPSISHYNLADGNTEIMNSGHDGCRIYDHYYDGTWRKASGVYGVRVYPGYKCYFQVCELPGVTDLTVGTVTSG